MEVVSTVAVRKIYGEVLSCENIVNIYVKTGCPALLKVQLEIGGLIIEVDAKDLIKAINNATSI